MIEEIFSLMNESERHGARHGIFPSWLFDQYDLTPQEVGELIKRCQ